LRYSLDTDPETGNALFTRQRELTPRDAWTQPDFADHTPRRHYCVLPWYSATIIATGEVNPCCALSTTPTTLMGNINEQSLNEIWNGEPYQRFRRDFYRLMLLRGNMETSPRFSGGIDPMCMKTYGCYFGFHTASPKFYEQLAHRLEAETPRHRRLAAHTRNAALRGRHRIKQMAKKLKS